MKHVEMPPVDYVRNHADAIARGDVAVGTPAPIVHRYVLIELRCRLRVGPHTFTASFDEVQRSLLCPECGVETFIPEQYRGMP